MRFGCVDEQGADIGFFDCGEGSNGGEFFDTNFAFTWFSKAGSIQNFNSLAFELDFYAINITSSALAGANEGLLLFAKGVEKAGFSNVRTAN